MGTPHVPSEEHRAPPAEQLAAAARALESLVNQSHQVQLEFGQFRVRYQKQKQDEPLPPRSLHVIRKGTRTFLDVQKGLAEVVGRATPRAGLGTTRPTLHPDPAVAMQRVATALAGSVMLYDNLLSILPLLGDRRYRRLVNHPDLGYGIGKNELWHVVERLSDVDSRRRLARLVALWSGRPQSGEAAAAADVRGLGETIAGSATYFLAQDERLGRRLPTAVRVRRERILDGLAQLGDDALYLVSEGFGNAIGRIELRKGKLWQREDVLGHLHRVLRPLDLLLEKTPFRLTDYFIPGHFGHVAIWMGRPRKLKRFRIWKHPGMQEERLQHCRPLIEEGRGVLEALRSGVELNPLRVFANVDDLAVLRPTRMKRKQIVESLVQGFHQVGKEYDFNFDVETTGTIVCSELPYHVYSSVDWRTEEQLGRFTISPDHVARAALGSDADFGLVAFYHDGALVPPKAAQGKLRELLA